MNNAQVPNAQLLTNLSAWAAAAQGWANGAAGVDVSLYSNDKVPAPGDTIASYTAVTLTGASAVPTATANVYSFSDGTNAIALGSLATYTPLAEPGSPLTAYGWFAKNHATGLLVAAARFTDPVQLHLGVTVAFEVQVGAPGNWSFPNPASP